MRVSLGLGTTAFMLLAMMSVALAADVDEWRGIEV
jgi:hypothetical protein